LLGCPWTTILPISASQVARITDMSHQHPALVPITLVTSAHLLRITCPDLTNLLLLLFQLASFVVHNREDSKSTHTHKYKPFPISAHPQQEEGSRVGVCSWSMYKQKIFTFCKKLYLLCTSMAEYTSNQFPWPGTLLRWALKHKNLCQGLTWKLHCMLWILVKKKKSVFSSSSQKVTESKKSFLHS
jgi:hypothetical protein